MQLVSASIGYCNFSGGEIIKRFVNARILVDHTIQEGELWIANGKIIAPQIHSDEEIDVKGRIIAPGLIDIQINGGFGCDFSRDPDRVADVAKCLPQFGVTGFFPTVVSTKQDLYPSILSKLQPSTYGGRAAANLGIHLEGPFFAKNYLGIHNPQCIVSECDNLEAIYGCLQGVKIVTLAPELPQANAIIHHLNDKGILVSAGHSAATVEQMKESIDAGINCCTHLFNAMGQYHHRESGIIGAALVDPKLSYSLILDGIHLSPETVLLCWACNPDGLILISDAMEALGLPNGHYQLGSMSVETRDGGVFLEGGNTIAGSTLSLDQAVRNLYAITGCSQAAALEAASLKPAQLVGIYPKKGTLSIGSDADFIILSDELEVEETYIGGIQVWSGITIENVD